MSAAMPIDCFTRLGRIGPSSSRSRDRAAISRKPSTAKPRWFGYLDDVVKYYDAVLIQPIVEGTEYRVFPARR
jgi:hypothetical protein